MLCDKIVLFTDIFRGRRCQPVIWPKLDSGEKVPTRNMTKTGFRGRRCQPVIWTKLDSGGEDANPWIVIWPKLDSGEKVPTRDMTKTGYLSGLNQIRFKTFAPIISIFYLQVWNFGSDEETISSRPTFRQSAFLNRNIWNQVSVKLNLI